MGTSQAGIFEPAPLETGWGASVDNNFARLADLHYNVKAYGALGDGIALDTTAITNAGVAIAAAGGGVRFFPAGTFLTAGLTTNTSSETWRGAGPYATTIKLAAGSARPLLHSATASPRRNLTIEDLTFDFADVSASGIGLSFFTPGLQMLRMRRVRLINIPATGITLQNVVDVELDDLRISSPGNHWGTAINVSQTCQRVRIRRPHIRYTGQGIQVAGLSSTTGFARDVKIIEPDIDLGFYTGIQTGSGSGAGVTYTAGVLTDTGAAFAPANGDHVRVLQSLALSSGTGVTYNATTLTDASASFLGAGIYVGYIVRAGGLFGIVTQVDSNTVLHVEEWLSETDRSAQQPPIAGSSYVVYRVILGMVTASTPTTITVSGGASPHNSGFWDQATGASVTPSAGDLYEILPAHPVYPIAATPSTEGVHVLYGRIRRGWGDGISLYGTRHLSAFNVVTDCADHGVILQSGSGSRSFGDTARRCGATGIGITNGTGYTDALIEGGKVVDCPLVNTQGNAFHVAGFNCFTGTDVRFINCDSSVELSVNAKIGLSVAGTSDKARVINFKERGALTTGIRVDNNSGTPTNTSILNPDTASPVVDLGTGTDLGTLIGTGTPEGAVTAPVGTLFRRTNGGAGTTLYVKESGTGNTGWVAK